MSLATSNRLDPAAVQGALLGHPSVADCAVIIRMSEGLSPVLVVYVVPRGPYVPDRLRASLDAVLPDHPPVMFVGVSLLPLTQDGRLDEEALATIPVLDDDVTVRWRAAVAAIPDTADAHVAIADDDIVQGPQRVHLSQLVPGWRTVPDVDQMTIGSPSVSTRVDHGSPMPSISHGEPLPEDPNAAATLADVLRRAAAISPDRGVVVVRTDGDVFLTYPALLEGAERVLGGLRRLGLRAGDKALFQLDQADEFITAFWGCVLGGVVPVPVSIAPSYRESNSTVAKLQNAWAMLDRPLVLGSVELVPELRAAAGVVDMPGLRVHSLAELIEAPRDEHWHQAKPDDLALLLLTSGSTGRPKAVMQSHRALLMRSVASARTYRFTRDEVSLNWLPMDHVCGIVMFHLHDICLGCQQVHAPTAAVLQDPLKWLDWVERYRVTVTWAPNFAFGLVNAQEEEIARRRWDLSTLRLIINAGELIVPRTARRFLELLGPHGLPPTAMYPAWGMSETCSCTTFLLDFSLETTSDNDQFVEVGTAIPGFSMRIVDASDQYVPEGIIGRLQVQGPNVTEGYFNNLEATQESFTADGWFKTGDLATMRNGRLTITGREKDVIIINGANYYGHEIENVVEDTLGVEVSFTAAFAIRDPGVDTDRLAICFTPTETAAGEGALSTLIREVRRRVVHKVGVNPTYLVPVARDVIPKTAIGKIQRADLARRLQGGEFDAILRRVDVLLENARTIPDWFYRRIWRARRIGPSLAPPQRLLAFVDDWGLGRRVVAMLEGAGTECVTVSRGAALARLGPCQWAVAPEQGDDYRRLLEALAEDRFAPDVVLHGWAIDTGVADIDSVRALEEAQNLGLFSLLGLAQALSGRGDIERRLRLVVVSRQAQVVACGDDAGPHATLPGLLKTIPQELAGIDCRHVDIDAAAKFDASALTVCDEICANDGEAEVAYRSGVRYVTRLQPADLAAAPKRSLPFTPGGFYVVTGGLGGIGSQIARELLDRVGARLLLLGRTPIDQPASGEVAGERAMALEVLRKAGDVIYEAVDVADPAALRDLVERASQRWQRELDGVIHLAACYDDKVIADESPAHMLGTLHPKVAGTWALRRLLSERPGALFVAFSSVIGFFGGFSVASYSAANAYLDASVEAERWHRGSRALSLAWSLWDEVGMSRGYAMKDLARARGYLPISKSQGLHSWLAALHATDGHLLIGLNGASAYVRRFIEVRARGIQQLEITSSDGSAEICGQLAGIDVRDRFGTRVVAGFRRAPNGSVPRTMASVSADEPRTEVEQTVARIWQEILQVDGLDLDSNFFDLGGTSLLIGQACQCVCDALGARLVMTDLFRYPTVRSVCQFLEGGGQPAASQVQPDQDRGLRRRERLQRQRTGPGA